jgi:hypothetical protein
MRIKSSWIAGALGTIAIAAGAPSWASTISLSADGLTYTLYESVPVLNPITHQYSDQFTLDVTGINGASDTEGGRYGVNSLAFGQPTPKGVSTGSLAGFTFMMGGLSSMGCDGTGNFYCFLAKTAPGSPPLSAGSSLQYTFDVTLKSGDTFVGYTPDFKIEWLGTKSKNGKSGYDLVSLPLTPNPVPLPATLPLLLGGLAAVSFLRRRRLAPLSSRQCVRARKLPAAAPAAR